MNKTPDTCREAAFPMQGHSVNRDKAQSRCGEMVKVGYFFFFFLNKTVVKSKTVV